MTSGVEPRSSFTLGQSTGGQCSRANIPSLHYCLRSLDIWAEAKVGQTAGITCYIMLPLARAFFLGGEAQDLSHCTLKTSPSLPPSIFPSQKPPVLASISPRQQGRLPFPWSGSHFVGKWKHHFSSREGTEYLPRTPQIISVLGATSTQLSYTAGHALQNAITLQSYPRACAGTHSIQT